MRRAPAPPPPARPPPPPRSPAPGPGPHCVRREAARPLACGGRRGGAGSEARGSRAPALGTRSRGPREPRAAAARGGVRAARRLGGAVGGSGGGARGRFQPETGRDFERSSRPSPSLPAGLPLPPQTRTYQGRSWLYRRFCPDMHRLGEVLPRVLSRSLSLNNFCLSFWGGGGAITEIVNVGRIRNIIKVTVPVLSVPEERFQRLPLLPLECYCPFLKSF